MPSFIGFIGLFGIAARNAIIRVSHSHHLGAEGLPTEGVVIEAPRRLGVGPG